MLFLPESIKAYGPRRLFNHTSSWEPGSLRQKIWGQVIFSVTLFLTVFSPLAYGAVEPWSIKVVGGGILMIICAGILQRFRHKPISFPPVPFLFCSGLLFCLIVCQLLPLPGAWRDFLSPATARNSVIPTLTWGPRVWAVFYSGSTISVHPSATVIAALTLAACLFFSITFYASGMEPWKFKALLATLIGLGTFEAIYGLIEYGAGTQHIFWLRKTYYLEEVTGTYINHNHFAGLMEMILPIAISAFVLQFSGSQERPLESQRRWNILPQGDFIGSSMLFVSICLMLTALVLSRSRGGLISFLIALIFMAYLVAKGSNRFPRITQVKLFLPILLALVALGLGREISTRFSYSVRDAPERFELWVDSFRIVRDFPWLGTGLGTYRDVLANYRPLKDIVVVAGIPQLARINYAHNDYLQFLVECGLIGFILLVWALVKTGAYLYKGIRASSDWELQVLGWGLVSGMLALALHGFVDFNFHIPANALIFSLYAGLALKLARLKEQDRPG